MAEEVSEKMADSDKPCALEIDVKAPDATSSPSALEDPEAVKAETTQDTSKKEIAYLHGWKLHFLTLSLLLNFFIVNMELSIISTSLVAITNEFQGFKDTTWVVTAYMITYTSFIIVWSKLSDIFGRKWILMVALFLFIAFSAACGSAQSMNQLIVCRTFQGIGASGVYGVSTIIIFQMVPKSKYPLYIGGIFIIVILSTASGPLLGGVINNFSTWRWIFFINIPPGVISMALILLVLPVRFPYHESPDQQDHKPPAHMLKRVDFVGASLLLSASLLLVTVLLEASTVFTWDSAKTICIMILSGLLWISFFVWEYRLSRVEEKQEPMFPWHFVHNRVLVAMLLTTIINGIPNTIVIINIPQRFQVVNGDSPIEASLRLLAYTVAMPLGSFTSNLVAGLAPKVPVIYYVLIGSILQLVGLALMSTIPNSGAIPNAQYAYEAIVAYGVGITFSILSIATPHCIDTKDLAVATGAMTQFRMIGAAIGLAIVTSISNSYLESHLGPVLSTDQLNSLLQSTSIINTLPSNLQEFIRTVFGQSYNLQTKILIGTSVAQFIPVGMMWRKQQLRLKS